MFVHLVTSAMDVASALHPKIIFFSARLFMGLMVPSLSVACAIFCM